ncbi:MAG: autotransporter outer membrane beta-barrel domain-containing protein, partial [Verrucomicrobiota bacterium]|nr:autotransporter outer membrane beta-barrel domain-containing protein [Verrucomicrobiota bacterium]
SIIDGKEGTNTLIIITQGTGNSSQIGTKYINFDILELNDSENFWNTTSNDLALDYIINSAGIGYVFFDTSSVSTNSSLFGDDKLYRNFGVIGLNSGDDIWFSATNDINLIRVSGNDGQDTVSFLNYETEITNFSKEMVENNYVDFENIILTSNSNKWTYSINDNVFSTIDASNGEDTLLVRGDINWTTDIQNRYEDFESLEIENGVLTFDSFSLGDDIENLILENNSIVDLQDGSLNNLVNYIQEDGSILKMNVQTNLSSSARIKAVHIEFNPDSSVQFFGDTGSFAVGNRYTNYLGQASSSIDVNEINLFENNPGSIDVKNWFIDSDGLYVIFDRRSLTNQLFGFNVPRGSQAEKILSEIDSLQTDEASRMADIIFSDTFSLNDLNKVYSRTLALPRAVSHQRNGILRSISERANERRIALSSFNKPSGVSGPIAKQTGTAIWSKGYSANGNASADNNIEGYDLSGIGTIIGLDYASGKYVAGIAAGIFNQTMKMDSSGEYTGSGTHLTGYMSYGLDGWFLETSATLANSSLDFNSDGVFNLETSYSANDLTFYFGGGYIMKNDKSSWTPEIGFILNSYDQDAAEDTSQEIVPTNLNNLSETSLQMRLGLIGGFKQDLIGRELLTQLKLRWMNSIGVSEEEIDYSLSGGSNVYQTPMLTGAKSIIEFGVGTQLRMNRSFSLLMGFDYEVGGGYSANRLSAGLRYSF